MYTCNWSTTTITLSLPSLMVSIYEGVELAIYTACIFCPIETSLSLCRRSSMEVDPRLHFHIPLN